MLCGLVKVGDDDNGAGELVDGAEEEVEINDRGSD